MKTIVYFVRHGESEANLGALLASQCDVALTPLGAAQAERTAALLRCVPLDAIYTSDLSRAVDTALPFARMRGMSLHKTKQLREFDAGEWSGMRYEDIAARYPQLYPAVWRDAFGVFCAPGGEPIQEAAQRLRQFVVSCCERHAGKTLLMVTHAGILRAFWGLISEIDPRELSQRLPFCENASFSKAVYEGGRLSPLVYGCVGEESAVDIREAML